MFFRLMFFQISIEGEHSGYSVKDTYLKRGMFINQQIQTIFTVRFLSEKTFLIKHVLITMKPIRSIK